MGERNVSKTRRTVVREEVRRHPVVEDFKSTMKLFVHNHLAFGGFLIVMAYFAIAILDAAYPQWLGIKNISSMLNFLPSGQYSLVLPTPPTNLHGWWYWFGTTAAQIPLLPSILAAFKIDMSYSVLIVLVGMAVGIVLGTISGYFGGLTDELLMRVTDIFLSLPSIVLAIAVVFVLGESLQNVVIALMIIW